MHRFIALSLIAALAFAVACGGSDKKPSPTTVATAATGSATTTSGSTASDPAAEAAAKGAVLTSDDFPSTWTSTPAGDDSKGDATAEPDEFDRAFQECSGESQDHEFAGQVADASSDDFTGPQEQSVSSDVTVFDSEAHAVDALATIQGAFDKCQQAFVDLAKGTFNQSITDSGLDPSAINLNIAFDKHEWTDLGDDSNGYRLTIDVPDFDVHLILDIVFIRQGRVGGTLFYQAGTEDEATRRPTANKVAAKLDAADKALD